MMNRAFLNRATLGTGIVAACLGVGGAASAATLPYSETFESYNVGTTAVPGWTFTGTGTNLSISVQSPANSDKDDTQSLEFKDTSGIINTSFVTGQLNFDATSTINSSVDLWISSISYGVDTNPPNGRYNNGEVQVQLLGTVGGSVTEVGRVALSTTTSGLGAVLVSFGNGSKGTQKTQILSSYTLDTKYTIAFKSLSDSQYSVSVNNTTLTGNYENDRIASDFTALKFTTGGPNAKDSTYYVDNVQVSAVPEPASVAALLTLGAPALLMRWRRR
jgi:hypothetical protein